MQWWPRVFTVMAVPPVSAGAWSAANWHQQIRVVVEPLRIVAIGHVWRPCGRGPDGRLLYSIEEDARQ